MKTVIKKFKTKYDFCKFQLDRLLNYLSKYENIVQKDNVFKTYEFYNEANQNIDITVANSDKYNITVRYFSSHFDIMLNKNSIIFKVRNGSLSIPIINIFFNDKDRLPIGNFLNLEFYVNNIITAIEFDRKLLNIKQDKEIIEYKKEIKKEIDNEETI